MQRIIKVSARALTHDLQHSTSGVLTVGEARRDKHFPVGKLATYGIDPSVDTGFARMNLLSATDQTHDDGPIIVSVHIGDQKLRLRNRETRPLLSSKHEVGCLLRVPGALRL